MADMLKMTVNVYAKIERGESDVNTTRLEQIAKMLGVQAEDISTFDTDFIFQNYTNQKDTYIKSAIYNTVQKELYERLLSEKDKRIEALETQIKALYALLQAGKAN
ncbi:MAG: XRE family transcriptional regulator [Bacteroidetes bacterium]|nr:MAG: XRE family transcriptional regulator [Bacteroidota bacterium]